MEAYVALVNYSSKGVNSYFTEFLEPAKEKYEKASSKEHTPYNRGKFEGIWQVYLYINGRKDTLTIPQAKTFFQNITGIFEDIAEEKITSENINEEIEKNKGGTGGSIKEIKRLRLEYQKRLWERSTYLFTKSNMTPAI